MAASAIPPTGYNLSRTFKYAIVYGGFAFIISLIREVVKDIEDIDGDTRYGCRTMPIVWGINVAKVFTATWLVVLISALAVIQFYFLPRAHWIMITYGISSSTCPSSGYSENSILLSQKPTITCSAASSKASCSPASSR